MNLRSGDPYWLYRTPFLNNYPALDEDLSTEVAVIGGGISGALAAYELIKAGCRVSLITEGHIGMASTCASTSLLQYEIDTPLNELIKKVGRETAVRSYQLCCDSIDKLQKIHEEIGLKKLFRRRKSLLLASRKKDVEDLKQEYAARINAGLDVKWLEEEEVKSRFGFEAPAALYSNVGAETDAYLFTQQLINWCEKRGMKVFDKTTITEINSHRNKVFLKTNEGFQVIAKFVVMATGYEAVKWIDRNIARLHSTYVIISEPVLKKNLWKD
ncbi:MAG: dependent oxidoreductase, partial [Bacteroidota bacterium]|nr:dependent oxidoreductase [Bacteroidota bacterium]